MPASFKRRAAPSPSFNFGWRLGVVIGAALVLMVSLVFVLLLVGRVWDEYF